MGWCRRRAGYAKLSQVGGSNTVRIREGSLVIGNFVHAPLRELEYPRVYSFVTTFTTNVHAKTSGVSQASQASHEFPWPGAGG
ncbi:hypothetical protein MCOR03_009977 [Pyricularia oryzae]|nr:hypothetical protein MCOR31_008095 [Pyricularia oryzae]KAI6426863.1 hypothetical protein MCOR24_002782 [Pyricularia oryzae]KAI6449234.1 hypothetical protein MCOR22_002384 [Pyricularia oryzae]KAI6464850.1 hypothetical protein MCOR17_005203 [Pyricularia oryzae]KAI6549573.1 hypothetical protein MCOR03_009977 [Pyricularia oryzae]